MQDQKMWVVGGRRNTRQEQMFSALPPQADVGCPRPAMSESADLEARC